MSELRTYQKEAIDDLKKYFIRRRKRIAKLVYSTEAGKLKN